MLRHLVLSYHYRVGLSKKLAPLESGAVTLDMTGQNNTPQSCAVPKGTHFKLA